MFSALYAKEAKKGHWADGKNEARYNGKIDVYTNLNAAFILTYLQCYFGYEIERNKIKIKARAVVQSVAKKSHVQ